MKKHLILFITNLGLLTACTPTVYEQIATLSSEEVQLDENGTFAYKDPLMTIEYNFWSETGKCDFIITNHSDNDLYLDLAKSYFIKNGFANDYYQARTYVYSDRSMASSKTTTAIANNIRKEYATFNLLSTSKSKIGNNVGSSETTSFISEKGRTVEYSEKPVICIPAHSKKIVSEFNITSSLYRECGFVRDPSKDEKSIKTFTASTSPILIENKLMFKTGEKEIPVNNRFFISQYQNIAYKDATQKVEIEKCDGTKMKVRTHIMSAKNRFYITYDDANMWSSEEVNNDRLAD